MSWSDPAQNIDCNKNNGLTRPHERVLGTIHGIGDGGIRKMKLNVKTCLVVFTTIGIFISTPVFSEDKAVDENPLYMGWAVTDITPPEPVALVGQLYKRISKGVRDPLTATVLALETRSENGEREQAIMISCDVISIEKVVQEKVQAAIENKLPDFDSAKLFLNATHTHTGPGFADSTFKGLYDVSDDEGVWKPSQYAEFFVERVSEAVVRAWESRKPAGVGWALGHAVVGINRRAHFFDGTTVMYGKTDQDTFQNIEGYEDHGVDMLFFWDENKKLTGMVINLACTSQETENLEEVSADFWHEVRAVIHKKYGRDVFVFPQCSAAGDQSPHLLYRKDAEALMLERRGLTRRQEIARRIANAIDDVFPYADKDVKNKIVFKHTIGKIDLPTEPESKQPFYETDSVQPIEIHVLRLGDVAIATNPFELYLDYGVRIEARSPALLTFLVQLSCQNGGYLPTEKAVQGGGYSADKYIVGPGGGQILVNETVRLIKELWQ